MGAELECDRQVPRDLFRRATNAGLIQQLICTELGRRGRGRRRVSLTMGNAKAIDLLAERDGKVTGIQVKTTRARRAPGTDQRGTRVLRF